MPGRRKFHNVRFSLPGGFFIQGGRNGLCPPDKKLHHFVVAAEGRGNVPGRIKRVFRIGHRIVVGCKKVDLGAGREENGSGKVVGKLPIEVPAGDFKQGNGIAHRGKSVGVHGRTEVVRMGEYCKG